jgi:hypothetical protein
MLLIQAVVVLESIHGPYVDIECALAGGAACRHGEDVRTARRIVRESNTEAINALIHSACEDLSITGEQLYAELEEGGDLPSIYSRTLTPKAL